MTASQLVDAALLSGIGCVSLTVASVCVWPHDAMMVVNNYDSLSNFVMKKQLSKKMCFVYLVCGLPKCCILRLVEHKFKILPVGTIQG